MANRTLRIISEPAENTERSVMVFTGEGPAIVGQGVVDLLCGQCGNVLVKGVGGRISNMVFKCRDCGAFNDTD